MLPYLLPQKIVVAITTHGHIPYCDITNTVEQFAIPQGFKLNKISIASPGNVNVTTEFARCNVLNCVLHHINSQLDSNKSNYSKLKDLGSIVQNADSTYKLNKNDPLEKKYAYGLDKGYTVHSLYPGDMIANKIYTSNCKEKTNNYLTMPILNLPDHELLDLMNCTQEVSLSSIIKFVMDNGVNELTIIDFSCSTFMNTNKTKFAPDKTTRSLRRKLNSDSVAHGGKSRKRKSGKRKSKSEKKRKRKCL